MFDPLRISVGASALYHNHTIAPHSIVGCRVARLPVSASQPAPLPLVEPPSVCWLLRGIIGPLHSLFVAYGLPPSPISHASILVVVSCLSRCVARHPGLSVVIVILVLIAPLPCFCLVGCCVGCGGLKFHLIIALLSFVWLSLAWHLPFSPLPLNLVLSPLVAPLSFSWL